MCPAPHDKQHVWPCIIPCVAMYHPMCGHVSSHVWPCIIPCVAMYHPMCGHVSSHVWPCIIPCVSMYHPMCAPCIILYMCAHVSSHVCPVSSHVESYLKFLLFLIKLSFSDTTVIEGGRERKHS